MLYQLLCCFLLSCWWLVTENHCNSLFCQVFHRKFVHCFRYHEITLLMSGSPQYCSSDKIFPHQKSPPAHPWFYEQKQHSTFNLKKKKKKGNLGPGQLSQPEQSEFCCVTRTQQVHLRLCSLPAPALFTFCWQGDLEVFGSALHSLGTIRQFTF